MMEQLTLLDMKNIDINSETDFVLAVRNNQIDDQSLAWASRREYLTSIAITVIIPVAELTDIPAWRNMCANQEIITTIEGSPRHNMYVKLNNGIVIAAATHVSEITSVHEQSTLYKYWNK